MLKVERDTLDQLAALLLERAGLKITPDGYHSLRLALSSRMPALGIADPQEYVSRIKLPAGEGELRALLPLVTVGHTEFFRDPRQFSALERRVLPDALTRARRHGRPVSIWSAGCATGEEPYSVAMALMDHGARPEEVDLWATDLNQAALDTALSGRFSRRRLAQMGEERRDRYFVASGEGYQIADRVKRYVRFEALNLAAPVFGKVQPESLDLILCRNVIIYFDLPTIRGLMDRFLAALRPGGLLFLGYSESLFKVYDRFEMVEIEGAFVYRRPTAASLAARTAAEAARKGTQDAAAAYAKSGTTAPVPSGATPASRIGAAHAVSGASAAIPQRAGAPSMSARPTPPLVSQETGAPRATSPSPTPPPPRLPVPGREAPPMLGEDPRALGVGPTPRTMEIPALTGAALARTPRERLEAAVGRMDRGDFEGSLTDVKVLLEAEPDDLDALLTLGNLHALLGHHADAAAAFAQALAREPLCVEARLFLGMAALQRANYPDARAEFAKALFLEPTLALGHYLIAQAHERLGDREAARRSYRNAIAQLRHPQRSLAGHYPDMPNASEGVMQAARYALAALEEDSYVNRRSS